MKIGKIISKVYSQTPQRIPEEIEKVLQLRGDEEVKVKERNLHFFTFNERPIPEKVLETEDAI